MYNAKCWNNLAQIIYVRWSSTTENSRVDQDWSGRRMPKSLWELELVAYAIEVTITQTWHYVILFCHKSIKSYRSKWEESRYWSFPAINTFQQKQW